MTETIILTFINYSYCYELGSRHKYEFEVNVTTGDGESHNEKIIRFGSSRNECMKKIFSQFREDFPDLPVIMGYSAGTLASPVDTADVRTVTVGGRKYLKISYFCTEASDNFAVQFPISVPIKPDELANLEKLTMDLSEQQAEYLQKHPKHGFAELEPN